MSTRQSWKPGSYLTQLSLTARLSFVALLFAASGLLSLFDASPRLVPHSKWNQPALRWDAFHFLDVAQNGYTHEHHWAFFPGVPLVLRCSTLLSNIFVENSDLLLTGVLLVIACDTTCTIYELSLQHFGSPSFAYLTSLLSLLPTSPSTLRFAPYADPFFTFFSYKGLLACSRSRWITATLYFTLAATFRSNGILLAGFTLWGLLIQPFLATRKIRVRNAIYSTLSVASIFLPFVYHQYTGYVAFCTTVNRPIWCNKPLPLIYSHVQSHYWNSGLFRYWTFQQIPNFLLAAPSLVLIFAFSLYHLKNVHLGRNDSPFLNLSVTPHAIHAFVTSCTLLFASHTQIVLRLSAAMPLTYWAAAWLLVEHPSIGRWWVAWSVVWGLLSTLFWASFLPPA